MSRWEQDATIQAEFSKTTGEVMLSASDVVAWLRANGECIQPAFCRPVAISLADMLTDQWLHATRTFVDGAGS